jgi:hypothetical protein
MYGILGKSPVVTSDKKRSAFAALGGCPDRRTADRGERQTACATLLTLAGWPLKIAKAFGARPVAVPRSGRNNASMMSVQIMTQGIRQRSALPSIPCSFGRAVMSRTASMGVGMKCDRW